MNLASQTDDALNFAPRPREADAVGPARFVRLDVEEDGISVQDNDYGVMHEECIHERKNRFIELHRRGCE